MTEALAINESNNGLVEALRSFFPLTFPLVVLLSALLLAIVSLREMVLAPAVFYLFFMLAGIVVCLGFFTKNYHKALKLFVYIFCFNTLFVILLYWAMIHTYGMPYMEESDGYRADQYSHQVLEIDNLSAQGAFLYYLNQGHSSGGWYYIGFIAALYKFTQLIGLDTHTLIPRFFNSLTMALLALLIWRFALLLGCGEKVALLCGYTAGVWPVSVFRSALIRRDAIFAFLLILSVFLFISFLHNKRNIRPLRILAFLFSITAVCILRFGFLVILSGLFTAIFLIWFYGGLTNKNLIARVLAGMVLIVMLSGVVLVTWRNDYIQQNWSRLEYVVQGYTERRGGFGEENVGVGRSIFRLPLYISLPLRLGYANIFPPPIPSRFILKNFRWIGTLVWFLCLPILLKTIIYSIFLPSDKYFALKAAALAFITFISIVSLTSFTEGHQLMYLPFGLLLIFYGLERQRVSIKHYAPFMIFCGVMAFGAYASLKFLA